MGRKRRRILQRNVPRDDSLGTIKAVLGTQENVLPFLDFIRHYAPSLPLAVPANEPKEFQRLLKTIVVPSESLSPALHISKAECREPVPSLIDDIVWSLVQRRERSRRLGMDGRNVLTQGYISSSGAEQSGIRPSSGMRPGVVCSYPNNIVSFCKTSSLFRQVHYHVGDEVLRMILLNTRLFVPVDDVDTECRENYMLVCGPPLRVPKRVTRGSPSSDGIQKVSIEQERGERLTRAPRPRKKRRRFPTDAPSNLKPNATISRHALFYVDSFIPKVGLSRKHSLNGSRNGEALLACIVNMRENTMATRSKHWKRLRACGVPMCDQILQRHAKCDYHRLLEKYCPLPAIFTKRNFDSSQDLANDSEMLPQFATVYTPSDTVVSFIAAVLRRVMPDTFWGSPQNFDQILNSVKTFTKLRRREKLSNKHIMQGVRITQFSWLAGDRKRKTSLSRTEHQAASADVLKVLRWIFRALIIPLLRCNFHVTESEFSSKRVLYYRKPVWSVFRSMSMRKLLKSQFVEITQSEARKRLQSQYMGFSRLRLLPKSTGVRPIAQLSRREVLDLKPDRIEPVEDVQHMSTQVLGVEATDPSGPPQKRRRLGTDSAASKRAVNSLNYQRVQWQSTNERLRSVFDVLRYEHGRKPLCFGAGLDGLLDLYPRYRRFVGSLKQASSASRAPKLYFASVDIQKCYDTINQDHLLDVTKQQLSQEEYLIQHCNVIHPSREKGGFQRFSKKSVGLPESYNPFEETNAELTRQCSRAIFTDTVKCSLANKQHVLNLLEEHLQNHLLVTSGRYKDRYLVQSSGISQGSILSTLLCNLYYGDIERGMLHDTAFQYHWMEESNTIPSGSLNFLARLVDDFIFVTTDKAALETFLQRMYRGNPELGAQINKDKTLVSSDVDLSLNRETPEDSVLRLRDGSQEAGIGTRVFPWCGMLFNTTTAEVLVDYSRFMNGVAKDGLTVERAGCEGKQMEFRMKSFVRPRCISILYDSSINGLEVVVTNFYQMMLFAAVKTAEYVRSSDKAKCNMNFLLRCISSLSSYSILLIQSELRRTSKKRVTSNFILSRSTATWLCWQAFHDVFSQLRDFEVLASRIVEELKKNGKHYQLRKTVSHALRRFQLHRMINP
jgi:hypothetical protein